MTRDELMEKINIDLCLDGYVSVTPKSITLVIEKICDAGYAIVPVEPTEEMCGAGWGHINKHTDNISDTYKAMIEAGRVK